MKLNHFAIVGGLVAVTALSVAIHASAGYKIDTQAYVNTTSRIFYGSMGSARNSADATQYVSCYNLAYSSGSQSGYCSARNSAGTTASCSTTNAALLDVIQSLGTDSYIYVTYDTAGACTYIYANQSSYYMPKVL